MTQLIRKSLHLVVLGVAVALLSGVCSTLAWASPSTASSTPLSLKAAAKKKKKKAGAKHAAKKHGKKKKKEASAEVPAEPAPSEPAAGDAPAN